MRLKPLPLRRNTQLSYQSNRELAVMWVHDKPVDIKYEFSGPSLATA